MNESEQTVGNFYGLHHEVFKYRGNPNTASLTKLLKRLKRSPSQLSTMTCMEAGGAGNKALTLARMGCRHVHHIDLSEENTRWMRDYVASHGDKLPITVTRGSILDRHPEFDNTFDWIICTGVIHHTLDPAKALMHLQAWLKTGGGLTINCYRSGSLYFFWAYLIRNLLSLIDINYAEFADLVDLYDIPLRKLDFMDHALVPVMHPTDARTFRHDLERLGFEVLRGDDDESYHSTTNPMLNFTARKARSFDGTLDELKYRHGIDQLALDYEQPCRDLLDAFSHVKHKIADREDRKTAVILSVLAITRIFNQCEDMDRGALWRLRNFRKTKDVRILVRLGNSKAHFYNNVRRYLRNCL